MVDLELARQVALRAADAASGVILRYYRGDFEVEIKADETPVTVADRRSEDAIRKVILDAFPDHTVHGEERGVSEGDSGFVWLVDPIDGTKSFVRGYPMFSCQIALMAGSELVLGVSTAPAYFGEQAVATKGKGTELDGRGVQVSETSRIRDAAISTGNIGSLAGSNAWPALGRILGRAYTTRGYGDFFHYHRLIAGQLDAVIESDLNILDIAALTVIVREAGGVMTDLQGREVGMETTSVLAANPGLHERLLAELSCGDL